MARDITQLHPQLQKKIAELKKICEEQGLKLGIGECFRSVEEQNDLYARGRTKPGKKVTNAKGTSYSSQHQWGIAFDFFKNIKGQEYSDSAFFTKVASVAKGLGLGWGGDWTSFKDRPHLYLPDWGSTTTKLKQQYGTPDKFMATWPKVEEKLTLKDAQTILKAALNVEKPDNVSKYDVDGDGTIELSDAQSVLKDALSIDNTANHSGVTELPSNTTNNEKGSGYMFEPQTVKKGSKGNSVLLAQEILRARGYKGKDGKELKLDKDCGTNTEYAINKYQTDRRKQGVELGTNKKNDGTIGRKMWADLIAI